MNRSPIEAVMWQKYKDAGDLANGLHWTLFEADQQLLSENAREKVLSEYGEEKVV